MADNDQEKKKEGTKAPDELAEAKPVGGDCLPPSESAPRVITNTSDDPVNVKVTNSSLDVILHGTPTGSTPVQGFWEYLRQRTDAVSFNEYTKFIKEVLCEGGHDSLDNEMNRLRTATAAATRLSGINTYQLLRLATEAFLLLKCGAISTHADHNPIGNDVSLPSRFGGIAFTPDQLKDKLLAYVAPDNSTTIPYFDRITSAYVVTTANSSSPTPIFCDNIDAKVLNPCFIELIWSYWEEELGLVQAINAISLRFQNKRGPGDKDPLANLETHPLRPLANLLWGYVQDEDHRLTVARRSYEYEHQYGIGLVGRAVPKLRPVDSRSKFLESFHTLLHQAAIFYDRSSNLTVRADAFPLLNALREVHLVLSEGAHNQFRELPWEARVEMLVQQWLLSRNEIREFVGGRPAVPYDEDWMRPVDALRRVMGWGETSVTHFNDLAITGEKIVLSVRFGDWSDRNTTDEEATGWAVFWKPEIQRYLHAYQAVTGVDLSATTTQSNRQIDATPPSVLLQQRIARQVR